MPEPTTSAISPPACPSCGHPVQLQFCPNCGQKLLKGRFTLSNLFFSFIESNFSFERGALNTIYRLAYQPGVVLRAYLSGATVRYFTPLKYLFIMISLSALIMFTSGIFDEAVGTRMKEQPTAPSQKQQAFLNNVQLITRELPNYMQILSLVQLPIFALVGMWFLKKPRLYYAEHLVIHAYALAQATFYLVVLMLISWAVPAFMRDYWSFMGISILLYVVVYLQFFNGFFAYKWYGSVLRTLLFYFIAFLIYMALLTIGMVVLAFLL